jgi:type I restriction enzyme, S subunit
MTEIQSFKGEWLPSIPVDWIQKKIKHVFNIRKVISGELGHDVISITQRGAKIKDIESGEGQLSMDYSKYQLVRCGDFLMNHMDLLTGYVDIAMFDGVTSPDYRVFELIDKNSFPKYHLYLFQHCYKSRVFYGYGRGSSQLGRWRFPTVEFENFFVPVPSYEEQELISRYLDKKTEQIDSLVEKIQKKIELLKEQRTSLINQCVTKGLDPNVEMKDTGVEWIGEIPKHWKLSRVKFELNIHNNNRVPLSAEVRGDRQGEYPYYGSTSIIDWVDDYLFDGRFILLAEDGGNLVLRNLRLSFIVEGKFWVNNHAHILKSDNDLYDHYYCEFLEQSDFTTFITGSAQPKLTLEAIKTVPVCVPNEDEISEITSELRTIKNQFRKLIEIHEKKIKYLEEYRQSLISSVVTGKVRVTEDMI